jgi:hypothetical protein
MDFGTDVAQEFGVNLLILCKRAKLSPGRACLPGLPSPRQGMARRGGEIATEYSVGMVRR